MINLHLHERIPLEQAIEELRAGRALAFATETVIGLGADAENSSAVAKIFAIKQRPSFNPLIVHVAHLEMAEKYGAFSDIEYKLAKAFWPGPLTMVMPLNEIALLSPFVTAGLESVGLRVPNHSDALRLLNAFGRGIAAPSANPSGKISPTHLEDIYFPTHPELKIFESEQIPKVGLESTIIRVKSGEIEILRAGAITREDIKNAVGISPLSSYATDISDEDKEYLISPGQMRSHYAPNSKMVLNVKKPRSDTALLDFGGQFLPLSNQPYLDLSVFGDLEEAGRNLFNYMRQLDDKSDCIEVAPIPNIGIGEAINDRLSRAAAPR